MELGAREHDAEQFETYRPLLFSIAYRMVGSASEAEDVVQEAYLRFHSGTPDAVTSVKALLTTIVTRLSINHLTSARSRRVEYLGPWLPEPVLTDGRLTQAAPEESVMRDESVSVALLVVLERLAPAERAVFLLRDVFGYDYEEVAAILGKSPANVRQLLSRAKRHIAERRPRFAATPQEHRELLTRFTRAIQRGSMGELVSMLAGDVTFWGDGGGKVPGAATRPVRGRQDVARLLLRLGRLAPSRRHGDFPTINGQPALVIRDLAGGAAVVVWLEVGDGLIHEIWAVANPDKLQHINRHLPAPTG